MILGLGLIPSVFASEPKIAVARMTIGSTSMLVDPKPITVGQRLERFNAPALIY